METPIASYQDKAEGEPIWTTLGEITELKNSLYLREYLLSSHETYLLHGVTFEEIEIDDVRDRARVAFAVQRNMQANPGILHGGLSFFYIDTVAAALVMARHPDCRPLTTAALIRYIKPGLVGSRCVAEAQFHLTRSEGPRNTPIEVYAVAVRDAATGNKLLDGEVCYYPKHIISESIASREIPPTVA